VAEPGTCIGFFSGFFTAGGPPTEPYQGPTLFPKVCGEGKGKIQKKNERLGSGRCNIATLVLGRRPLGTATSVMHWHRWAAARHGCIVWLSSSVLFETDGIPHQCHSVAPKTCKAELVLVATSFVL
jgi:hypothetical protein